MLRGGRMGKCSQMTLTLSSFGWDWWLYIHGVGRWGRLRRREPCKKGGRAAGLKAVDVQSAGCHLEPGNNQPIRLWCGLLSPVVGYVHHAAAGAHLQVCLAAGQLQQQQTHGGGSRGRARRGFVSGAALPARTAGRGYLPPLRTHLFQVLEADDDVLPLVGDPQLQPVLLPGGEVK